MFIRSLLMPRLAVLVLMAGAAGTLAGQEPPDKALTQLRGLNVLIEPLAFAGPADTAVSFDSLGLKHTAQQRLAEAGMRVVSDSQSNADPSLPFLDIEASLLRDSVGGEFIYCVTAMVYQEVVADHDEHLLAAIWASRVRFGRASGDSIAATLQAKALLSVDALARAYRAANPQRGPAIPSEHADLAVAR